MRAPFLDTLQYQVDAWSGQSKPLFHLPVPKIYFIYGPHIGDVSDIRLITDFFSSKYFIRQFCTTIYIDTNTLRHNKNCTFKIGTVNKEIQNNHFLLKQQYSETVII